MREVGLALAQAGWQVDMFTRRSSFEQAAVIQHSPNCRTIRLTAGPAKFINRDEVYPYLPEGRFDPRKGIETLVRAIAKSSLRGQANLQLIIGGGFHPGHSDGIERDRIQDIVNELGLGDITTFPGQLGDTNLHLYYAAADVCVVPSHYEPFGLVALEAMASGTPVVASEVGGLPFTVVPEVTGLLVPPQDEVAFAQAIDQILANPAWAFQLGQTGRQRVEIAFSWYSVASRLSSLYTQLLARSASVTGSKSQVAA